MRRASGRRGTRRQRSTRTSAQVVGSFVFACGRRPHVIKTSLAALIRNLGPIARLRFEFKTALTSLSQLGEGRRPAWGWFSGMRSSWLRDPCRTVDAHQDGVDSQGSEGPSRSTHRGGVPAIGVEESCGTHQDVGQ